MGGEFGNLQEAIGRLRVVVPVTLGLIALLLWINFGSLTDTLLTMSVIPMAVIGGLFGLYITGVPFSVSAAIGFIALFGISVMNGIVVLCNTIFSSVAGWTKCKRYCKHARSRYAPF